MCIAKKGKKLKQNNKNNREIRSTLPKQLLKKTITTTFTNIVMGFCSLLSIFFNVYKCLKRVINCK